MESMFALATGLSLAAAVGLNAYIPLLSIGILSRLGLIELVGPFDLIGHGLVLAILAVLAIIDFVGDKLPAIDSGFHALGLIISPVAGAIVTLSSQGDLVTIHPVLLVVAGLIVALSTHGSRAAMRPIITAATGGTANPVVSAIEDASALVLTILAIFLPVVALVVAIAGAFVAYRVFRRATSVWQKREA
ncbi:MAG: DUF4126 domain-containing protein [Candidatus Viridilinea halotolerans]|uniref:DUF4126 domain-containing protein n=1 Tax=Candidatus Viridilinea halotolerans TaxID=2491704 RepID=A0A426TQ92_9CHLR|nr:MAG: DUF4126 domain-containing protein [Candidatus Viridilinea halotolerans]